MNLLPGFVNKWAVNQAIRIATAALPINRYYQSVFPYLSSNSVIWINDEPEKYISEGYYLNPDVYGAVNVIVRLASVAPLNLYRIKDKKQLSSYKALLKNLPDPNANPVEFRKHWNELQEVKTKALEEVFNHKIIDLFKRPNEYQSEGEFLENCYGFRLTTGNFLAYKAKAKVGTAEVMGLYLLPVQNTQIISGGLTEPIKKYKVGYSTDENSFDPEEIIHNRGWSLDYSSPGSHMWGPSPLRAALRSVKMGNDGREAQTYYLQNKGSDVMVALDPTGLNKQPSAEQLSGLKDDLRDNSQGKNNRGKVTLAVGKISVHPIGGTSTDIGVDSSIKLSKEDICKAYGISPILLASMEASTFANYKEAKKAAITMAAIPLLLSVRDSWNKDLLPEFEKGETYMLDYDLTVYQELQEDREKQANYLSKAEWLTLNEKRIEMGYAELPDANMNKIYLGSSTPIDQVNNVEVLNDVEETGDY
ncbi:MAG TPA: phage portal protein [Segetibacter sp.]